MNSKNASHNSSIKLCDCVIVRVILRAPWNAKTAPPSKIIKDKLYNKAPPQPIHWALNNRLAYKVWLVGRSFIFRDEFRQGGQGVENVS